MDAAVKEPLVKKFEDGTHYVHPIHPDTMPRFAYREDLMPEIKTISPFHHMPAGTVLFVIEERLDFQGKRQLRHSGPVGLLRATLPRCH